MLFPGLMTQFFVIAEFCREVSDIQMPHVAPLILPEMYKIFVHADVRLKNKYTVIYLALMKSMIWEPIV